MNETVDESEVCVFDGFARVKAVCERLMKEVCGRVGMVFGWVRVPQEVGWCRGVNRYVDRGWVGRLPRVENKQ